MTPASTSNPEIAIPAAHGPGLGKQVAAATLISAAAIFGPVALTFHGIRKGARR